MVKTCVIPLMVSGEVAIMTVFHVGDSFFAGNRTITHIITCLQCFNGSFLSKNVEEELLHLVRSEYKKNKENGVVGVSHTHFTNGLLERFATEDGVKEALFVRVVMDFPLARTTK